MTNNVDTSFTDGRHGLIKAVIDVLDAREKAGGGGSGGGAGVGDKSKSDWKETVETRLGQLHGDIRMMLTALIGLGVLIIGLLVGLYMWAGSKFDSSYDKVAIVSEKSATIDVRLQGLEKQISEVVLKLDEQNKILLSMQSKNK